MATLLQASKPYCHQIFSLHVTTPRGRVSISILESASEVHGNQYAVARVDIGCCP